MRLPAEAGSSSVSSSYERAEKEMGDTYLAALIDITDKYEPAVTAIVTNIAKAIEGLIS